MAKDVIHLHGQDRVVREDTAKAFRGVHWALWTLVAFILIAATLFAIFFLGAAADGKIESPSQLQNSKVR